MSQELGILGISAAVTAGIQFLGFLAAYALQTEKFYDIVGGINFLVLGIYSAIDGQYQGGAWLDSPRKVAGTIIFSVSRAWLLMFLAWRAHERGGDSRFDEVKDKFWMFLVYWTVQAIWVFTISMPIIFINSSDNADNGLSVFDWICIGAFAFAVLLEVTADIQKAIWVKAGRTGGFCTAGVWQFSRHPNYFGEILQWWAAWGLAYGSGTGVDDVQWWVSILSPVFTMQVLLNTGGTGVANANGANLKRYYDKYPVEYAKYRKETSILLPMIGYKYVPMVLKRTIFFDLERYEYHPEQEEGDADKPKTDHDYRAFP
jgi:steroid 5-alpha reductase family enzyme